MAEKRQQWLVSKQDYLDVSGFDINGFQRKLIDFSFDIKISLIKFLKTISIISVKLDWGAAKKKKKKERKKSEDHMKSKQNQAIFMMYVTWESVSFK